ncbi:MAG: hypothetical protein AB1782_09485 [Cyanobacteriota bacterium]
MQYRKLSGNSLSQYAIIIALVALASIPGFYFIGKNLIENFGNLYHGLKGDGETVITLNTNSNPGSLISSNVPAAVISSECKGKNCTLTVGDIVLKDVSADLAEIIETSGASGATDHLANVLQQLGDQAGNVPGVNSEDASKINQLAALAYQIAEKEKNIQAYTDNIIKFYERDMANFDAAYFETLSPAQKEDYLGVTFKSLIVHLESKAQRKDFYKDMFAISNKPFPPVLEMLLDQSDLFSTTEYTNASNTDQLRQDFDQLVMEIKQSNNSLNPQLKNIITVLSGNVQLLADNMYNAFYDRLENIDPTIANIIPHEDQTAELGYVVTTFGSVSSANNGLTSQQTNLNAQLIDLSEDNEIDANESTQTSSEDGNVENNTNENETGDVKPEEESKQELSDTPNIMPDKSIGSPGE